MIKRIRSVMALKSDKRGVTAVEYGIMAALIAAVLVTAVGTFTSGLSSVFTNIGNELSTKAGSISK